MVCGTCPHTLLRAFALGLAMLVFSGCLVDDPAPCTIKDEITPEPECLTPAEPEERLEFKVEYTTANGTRPDGRYGFSPTPGLTISQSEVQCRHALQFVFNTDQAFVDAELAELQFYRGDVCGNGFRLKSKKGEIRVKKVRQGISSQQYDYDLELTCTEI